jgi:PPK2 family polyphosphate:nucleotide phosphotransferase
MKIQSDKYCAIEGKKVNLKKWPTKVKPIYNSKKQYQKKLAEQINLLSQYQNLHYASNKNALLIIFQAMDAAGKDGTIKHVMSGINPQGCQVYSFKHPSATELEHDFLWRTTRVLPERGKIGIFNRSYYEEVLITRVHLDILQAEGVPILDVQHKKLSKKKIWKERYNSITNLEKHLQRNGTKVIKFFLHLSKAEQGRRFLERINEPEKNWKIGLDDIKERGYWNEYMKAYEECISETSTADSPWFIVPADDKLNTRLIVSQIILDAFDSFDMEYPKADAERLKELQSFRQELK